MKKTKEEKLALLNETILYYSENTKRRCRQINENGENACFYNGANNNKTESSGCAVGRLIPIELAEELDNRFEGIDSTVFEVFHFLPQNVKDYGKKFLGKLQLLHDVDEHWDEMGLTEIGNEYVFNTFKNILKV